MKITHLQVYKPTPFGKGMINTTLCGRVQNTSADYNNTDIPDEVTCKLCNKKLKKPEASINGKGAV